MNNIVVLLSIQVCILLLFPLIRRIIKRFFKGDNSLKRASFGFFSFINIVFPISILGLFLNSYFREISDRIVSSFLLFETNKYSIEIGYRISIIQILIYFTLCILAAVINNYFGHSKISKSELVDKFSIFSMVMILFIFSPNFFQLILFMFAIDMLFLDFLSTSSIENSSEKKPFIHSFLSIITGNLLILISSALLIRKVHSFDFNAISSAIQYRLFIFNPYFQALIVLFLLGIFAKVSLFPFHTWIRNNIEIRDKRIILVFLIYVPTSLFMLIGTPILSLLPVVQNFVIWYGICIALTAAFFAIFLRKQLESLLLLFISSIGLILYSIGVEYYSVGLNLILITPVLFSNLVIIKLTKKGHEEEVVISFEERKKVKRVFLHIFAILSVLTLIGVGPLNSLILSLTYPLTLSNLIVKVFLLLFGIVSLIFIFISVLDLVSINWLKEESVEINKGVITSTSVLTFFLMLASILFPYFEILSPIPLTIDFLPNSYLLTVLPLGICYLIVLLVYLLIKKYFSEFHQKLQVFNEKISIYLRQIFTFEFIFTPLIYVTKKFIIPSSRWLYEKIILLFIFEMVVENSIRFLKFCIQKLKTFILDYLIPWIKKLYTNLSHFSRRFEDASQRTQLYVAFSFLFILLVIVVSLFVGGKI